MRCWMLKTLSESMQGFDIDAIKTWHKCVYGCTYPALTVQSTAGFLLCQTVVILRLWSGADFDLGWQVNAINHLVR